MTNYNDKIEDKLFTPDKKYIEEYEKSFIAALNSKDINAIIIIGKTPAALKYFTPGYETVETSKYIINKSMTMDDNHKITPETIKRLPELIHNPLAILSSKTQEGSKILVLDELDKVGRQAIAIIQPRNWMNSDKEIKKINFIPSMYGRNEFESFMNSSFRQEKILYIKEKVPHRFIQLQLPSEPSEELIKNIATKEDIVMRYLENIKEKSRDGLGY